jgi:tetratricopeptide (TPR) repeat protein
MMGTVDPIDRAGALLNVAATLTALGEYDLAKRQLDVVRLLTASSNSLSSTQVPEERVLELQLEIEVVHADIINGGENKKEEALTTLSVLLEKHQSMKSNFRNVYQMIQTRRGFILADLGRWRDALPILEEADSFEKPRELISFYLGHACVATGNYAKGKEKLVAALTLGLPPHFEFRAHCALGEAYYMLRAYLQAKLELEKCAEAANPSYIKQANLWEWLRATCMQLGLTDEAARYAQMARPPT